jgi:5'-3' exonuclease
MIQLNLILDGNYILNKNTFALQKNNLLFGNLMRSLEITLSNYKKWFPFANIYLVSDKKSKSWRKEYLTDYKSSRKKDTGIDWEFVFNTYDEFKKNAKGVKILEEDRIEGDDWIYYICKSSNIDGFSNLIVSNDHDIKQLLHFNVGSNSYMNFMCNEMNGKEKLFLPKNWEVFWNHAKNSDTGDIFDLNDDREFIKMFEAFLKKSEIVEVESFKSLFIKLVSGDNSDNIKSVHQSRTKTGKDRNIGKETANTLWEVYNKEFGEPTVNDPDLLENIADIICEKRKLPKTSIEPIIEKLKRNKKLIHLEEIPKEIINKMESKIKIINNV